MLRSCRALGGVTGVFLEAAVGVEGLGGPNTPAPRRKRLASAAGKLGDTHIVVYNLMISIPKIITGPLTCKGSCLPYRGVDSNYLIPSRAKISDQALIRCTINWSVSDQFFGHLIGVWSVPNQALVTLIRLIRPIKSPRTGFPAWMEELCDVTLRELNQYCTWF